MRPRTKNEKILLAILGAVIFLGGNFYGYQWLWHQQSALNLTYMQLRADKAEAEVDLQKADMWATRKAWIQENEPALGNGDDAEAQLLQYVLKGAREHQMEIMSQSLGDTQKGSAGTAVNVSLKVKGSIENLCHWLADLQKPANFYAVSSFSLKADQDLKSYICTLQLTRYYKEGS